MQYTHGVTSKLNSRSSNNLRQYSHFNKELRQVFIAITRVSAELDILLAI